MFIQHRQNSGTIRRTVVLSYDEKENNNTAMKIVRGGQ